MCKSNHLKYIVLSHIYLGYYTSSGTKFQIVFRCTRFYLQAGHFEINSLGHIKIDIVIILLTYF